VGGGVVLVIPDDLTRAVDAEGLGALGVRGMVERGVGATAKQEALEAVAGLSVVVPNDLARPVDALCEGFNRSQRIVEGGVGINWHDTGSSVIVSVAEKRRSGG